jgi:hypothetical protein
VERRLAAVLIADVAGLKGIDEEGTLARLKAVRKTLVDPTIAARIPSSDFRFWHFRACRDSLTTSAHRGIPPQGRDFRVGPNSDIGCALRHWFWCRF